MADVKLFFAHGPQDQLDSLRAFNYFGEQSSQIRRICPAGDRRCASPRSHSTDDSRIIRDRSQISLCMFAVSSPRTCILISAYPGGVGVRGSSSGSSAGKEGLFARRIEPYWRSDSSTGFRGSGLSAFRKIAARQDRLSKTAEYTQESGYCRWSEQSSEVQSDVEVTSGQK